MLTKNQISALIERKSESKNLDYKRSMNWNTATAEEKAAIAKDVLAMSNTHAGGCVLFGVRDHDFEAVGLSESDFGSFDATRFSDFINRFADPPLECHIHKYVIEGKRFVAIEVLEFSDVPVICKGDLNACSNRQVLKKGATYIRTQRASSEIVSSAETMRELIDRAMARRGDHFLKMVDRVIAGKMANRGSERNDGDTSLRSKLEDSYDITLELLSDLLDRDFPGHSKRVTAYTIALARVMGISKAEIRDIARGAFLHDIGKAKVPNRILSHPRELNAEELRVVREHCLKGYQFLSRIPLLEEASKIVYSHHENFDGNGYPRGLKGEDIPLAARIVAVANTLDSITSDLPYRAARSFAEARAEIYRCTPSQFDPKVVHAFQRTPDKIFEALRNDIYNYDSTMEESGSGATG